MLIINLSTHRFHSSVYKIDVVASQIDLVVLWEAAQIKHYGVDFEQTMVWAGHLGEVDLLQARAVDAVV
jgi:hypothetical protein